MREALHHPIKILIWLALLAYGLYLWMQNAFISNWSWSNMNLLSYFLLFLIAFLIILTNFNVFTHFSKNRRFFKWDQMLFWLIVILLANYFFKDNPEQNIYTRDILNLIWVAITILASLWYLYTEKQKQQHFEEKVEIIEV